MQENNTFIVYENDDEHRRETLFRLYVENTGKTIHRMQARPDPNWQHSRTPVYVM